jgi:hypothetical protein
MKKQIMENEKPGVKPQRHTESGLYLVLKDTISENFDRSLETLIKVARSSNERELLNISDILLEFVGNNEKPEMNERIVVTTIDEIFPILNRKNPEKIKALVKDEYQAVLENLQKIKDSTKNKVIASKCHSGMGILIYPGSKIIDGEILDS